MTSITAEIPLETSTYTQVLVTFQFHVDQKEVLRLHSSGMFVF